MKTGMIFATALLFVALASVARADVLKVAPESAVVLPADDSGVTRVALTFDLSGMRSGTGRQIVIATIDWPIEGMTVQDDAEFSVHRVTAGWSATSVGSGETSVSYEETPSSVEQMDEDTCTAVGGLLRLRATKLVEDWIATPSENYGVIVTLEGATFQQLAEKLDAAELDVRYVLHESSGQ